VIRKIVITEPVTIVKKIENPVLEKITKKVPVISRLLERLPQKLVDKIFCDDFSVNERIFERPFVFLNLPPPEKNIKVLDAGCSFSVLSLEMASIGYKVWGIDLIDYPFQHPNLEFLKADISAMPFPDNFFDAAAAISTIEHVGIGHYGDPVYENGDYKAVNEIRRVLKPGGKFIITVPYGKKMVIENFLRIYDEVELRRLLSGFKIEKIFYFTRLGKGWHSARREEAATKAIDERGRNLATVLVSCLK